MTDQQYIQRACTLARQALGQTSPNPAVGAVIVCDGQIIAEGFHAKAGTPHAERVAIANAESLGFDRWDQATIYVTLEPCSTHGRTGACSDAIVRKGFRRVVYGSVDPNPAHVGRADQILTAAGIEVSSRVNEEECDHLLRAFAKVQCEGMPWVIVKSAMSLDGKITRPPGEGQWLTGTDSRHYVHLLRAEVDAVITGGNTVRADNPQLNVRLEGRDPALRQPRRVIFTTGQQPLPPETHLLQDPETLIYETATEEEMRDALRSLAQDHGVNSVLVEAGGGLIGALADLDLIDEVVMFYAPMLTGGDASGVAGHGCSSLSDRLSLQSPMFTQLGNDVMLRALVSRQNDKK